MNKKTVFGIIAVIAIIASVAMYKVGHSSSHLSELKDFWWTPLPLAAICLLIVVSSKPKA
jgi:magnesium-transporting ATPase (P-type)